MKIDNIGFLLKGVQNGWITGKEANRQLQLMKKNEDEILREHEQAKKSRIDCATTVEEAEETPELRTHQYDIEIEQDFEVREINVVSDNEEFQELESECFEGLESEDLLIHVGRCIFFLDGMETLRKDIKVLNCLYDVSIATKDIEEYMTRAINIHSYNVIYLCGLCRAQIFKTTEKCKQCHL